VFALSLIVAIAGSLPFLLVNLDVEPEAYPGSWIMVLASMRAGVREEIFHRLFLMTILAGLGGLVQRDEDGRPSPTVMWCAVILSGFLFGYDHIDEVVPTPEIYDALILILLLNTMFGIVFGWLYWKQGLESAILAHFMVDAVGSGIVVPIYLLNSPLLCVTTAIGLILVVVISWRALIPRVTRPSSPEK
jgi:membrane protease YdiL (CAAX protease family)